MLPATAYQIEPYPPLTSPISNLEYNKMANSRFRAGEEPQGQNGGRQDHLGAPRRSRAAKTVLAAAKTVLVAAKTILAAAKTVLGRQDGISSRQERPGGRRDQLGGRQNHLGGRQDGLGGC